jgi:hypothetical protein
MVISFVLDWGSFFVGALALFLLEFLVLVLVAVGQALKQSKAKKAASGLLGDLGEPLKKRR